MATRKQPPKVTRRPGPQEVAPSHDRSPRVPLGGMRRLGDPTVYVRRHGRTRGRAGRRAGPTSPNSPHTVG